LRLDFVANQIGLPFFLYLFKLPLDIQKSGKSLTKNSSALRLTRPAMFIQLSAFCLSSFIKDSAEGRDISLWTQENLFFAYIKGQTLS